MRIILHGTEDIEGMAKIAKWAIENRGELGRVTGVMRPGIEGDKFYSVKFGLGSVSVWVSD